MFKNYSELGEDEKNKLIDFINRNEVCIVSKKDLDKQFKVTEFDYGKSILLYIIEEKIVGIAQVLVKECTFKGIAYIINVNINERCENKIEVFKLILEQAKNIALKYGAKEIYLGSKDNAIKHILNSLHIKKQYSVVKMILEDLESKQIPFNIYPVSRENKKEYLNIYNEAFNEVSNGSTLTEDEIREYIKNADDATLYFIVKTNNKSIGFLQFHIDMNEGQFDLGLIPSARGKGYGNRLLETAIIFLKSRKVTDITLIVTTKNSIAYEMYKKRGFIEVELISDWHELNYKNNNLLGKFREHN